MEQINLDIIVQKAFGNLYRNQCVLVAVQNKQGNILLGGKPNLYPSPIVRMLGGGVHPGETVPAAAVREIAEELGVMFSEPNFTPLFEFNTKATDKTGKVFKNQTYVYHLKIGSEKYLAGDDVAYIAELTLAEMQKLGDNYQALPETLWFKNSETEFCWADYGKMYGPIHKIAADRIARLNNQK
jgi:8-oxo-dGTP pyrophosphatase MutT (NUDIX family)